MHGLPLMSPRFPYTTLFRSPAPYALSSAPAASRVPSYGPGSTQVNPPPPPTARPAAARSEEHTSELQSRENLVCRLLLEKKKRLSATYLIVLYRSLCLILQS